MRPRVYQPLASAASAPPSPSVLCFSSTDIKNTPGRESAACSPLRPGVHFLASPVPLPSLREASKGDPPASSGGPLPRP